MFFTLRTFKYWIHVEKDFGFVMGAHGSWSGGVCLLVFLLQHIWPTPMSRQVQSLQYHELTGKANPRQRRCLSSPLVAPTVSFHSHIVQFAFNISSKKKHQRRWFVGARGTSHLYTEFWLADYDIIFRKLFFFSLNKNKNIKKTRNKRTNKSFVQALTYCVYGIYFPLLFYFM